GWHDGALMRETERVKGRRRGAQDVGPDLATGRRTHWWNNARGRRLAPALGPPVLIIVSVLVVLRLFAFRDLMSHQYPDVLPFWFPTYCFLGKTLAAGHLAGWNPHVMGGTPFAPDPQSGWMYATPMALFSALPCHVAIRWFIVAQPLLMGLGLYGFCRSEGLPRAAATVGGLTL